MVKAASRVSRVFVQQPDRVAAAWRRLRKAQLGERAASMPLLDELIESFVREVGRSLLGTTGSPWSRTRGVLRISAERGARALFDEFSALRRCLADAVEALEGTVEERRQISWAIDEAVDSAVAISQQMADPRAEGPLVPFGGVVVEVFEQPELRAPREAGPSPASLH
jgi:hypothetical protein